MISKICSKHLVWKRSRTLGGGCTVYDPGFTAVKKSGDVDSCIDGNFGVHPEVLVLKDLSLKFAKGCRGLLYLIF